MTVYTDLYRVLCGEESLAEFIEKCAKSMETEISYDAYATFKAAMDAVPNTSNKELRYAGWTDTKFISLTDKVSAYNGGMEVVAVGTRTALKSVLPSNSELRIQIDSDYVKVGHLLDFFGVKCVVLPQVANWQDKYTTRLADNRIWVMCPSGEKIVKLCIEGETLSITDDTYGNADLTQKSTMKKRWGTASITSAIYGQIELS